MKAQVVMTKARTIAELALVAVAATLARGVWLPLERHRFDGHEADYLAAFQGAVLEPSTRHMPLLAGAYRALGRLTDAPEALLAVNVLAGVVTVVAGATLARREGRLGTGLLLALGPTLVFWSASAYHVALPLAFAVAGAAVGGWGGAVLYAIACANRLELALLAPAIVALGGWRPALGAIGAVAGWPLLDSAPALVPVSLTLPANLQLPDFLGALGEPLGLLVVALAVRRRTLPLLGAAVWVHLVGSCFDDYGTRHGLLGAVCLAVLVGSSGRWWAVVAGIAWSAWRTSIVATWFYAPQPVFDATVPSLGPPPACTEVLDDPLAEASHWGVRDAWPEGTVCWGEERIHRAWTSRALQDRALRMHRLYAPEPLGVLRLESGPRIVYEVTR